MNRTQGDPEWTLLRPWVQVPSNCIAPTRLAKLMVDLNAGETTMWGLQALCAGSARFGSWTPEIESTIPFWAFLGETYNPLTDAPNFGRGIAADLSGNNLPNSPELTANIGSQYTFYGSGWDVTVRGDYYWQSDSYFRVYNTEYDRIRAWDNLNLSITVVNAARDLELGIYVIMTGLVALGLGSVASAQSLSPSSGTGTLSSSAVVLSQSKTATCTIGGTYTLTGASGGVISPTMSGGLCNPIIPGVPSTAIVRPYGAWSFSVKSGSTSSVLLTVGGQYGAEQALLWHG